jgi:MFS family permease
MTSPTEPRAAFVHRSAGALTASLGWVRGLDWHARSRGRAGVLAVLSFTMWLNWGSTYYLLTVLAKPIAADTGWPLTSPIAGLALGLIVAGLVSPAVGRTIEHRGGRLVLAFGSAMLALGLMGLGFAASLAEYLAAWVVIGIGMAASLYDAAFAALGRLYGLGARSLISSLMLIGGFALVTTWPLTAFLAGTLGWRGACFCYAALHLFVGFPVHLLLWPAEARRPRRTRGRSEARPAPEIPGRAGGSATVLLLAANLTLQIAIGSALAVHILTLLQGLGIDLFAAVALSSLIWFSQGGGRLLELIFGQRFHPASEGLGASILVLAGLVLLLIAQPNAIALGLVLFGIGNGVRGIVKGTLPLALFGAEGYPALVGRLGLPTLLAQAMGPMLSAVFLTRWGAQPSLFVLAALALVNLLLSYVLYLAVPARATASEAARPAEGAR